MYQRQVSSRPRSVRATRSSRLPLGLGTDMIRLSAPGVAPAAPNRSADQRVCARLVSTPSRIQSTSRTANPLSNTDAVLPEDEATWNGAHSSPGAVGSLRMVTGRSVSFSPRRGPPPGAPDTLRAPAPAPPPPHPQALVPRSGPPPRGD